MSGSGTHLWCILRLLFCNPFEERICFLPLCMPPDQALAVVWKVVVLRFGVSMVESKTYLSSEEGEQGYCHH